MGRLELVYLTELQIAITKREGMVAENAQRIMLGQPMAYWQDDFEQLADVMEELMKRIQE